MTAGSGTGLWRTASGSSGRVCYDCRTEVIVRSMRLIETLTDRLRIDGWMEITDITPAEVVAGLDRCDACGTTVALAVRS